MRQNFSKTFIGVILFTMLLLSACSPAAVTPENLGTPEVLAATVPALPTAAVPAATAVLDTPAAGVQQLILATTTSTDDSGLLDTILPDFEALCGCQISVVAVGSGQALQLGIDGNADVLLVHSPAKEQEFMANGDGVRREDVMYNDFVILGPADDPAGITEAENAAEAFQMIAASEETFISRGDDSGTHVKEKTIWQAAEIDPVADWYISAGQGMGSVLTMADELQAYTLSDRATYLARTLEGIYLNILVQGDPILFNPYGVIAVNPAKNPNIKADLANQFIDWLISVPVQEKIGQFGMAEFGQALFTPDSAPWKSR